MSYSKRAKDLRLDYSSVADSPSQRTAGHAEAVQDSLIRKAHSFLGDGFFGVADGSPPKKQNSRRSTLAEAKAQASVKAAAEAHNSSGNDSP